MTERDAGATRNVVSGQLTGQAVQASSIDQVHFHAAAPRGGSRQFDVPEQLPMRPRRFVARDEELATLRRWRAEQADGPLVVVLTGTGGVGKSALALRWLHEISADLQDGTLFVELGGDSAEPVSPGQALQWFLESLGVPGKRIPAEPAQRAALFRSVTADRRLAVCLDNAVSAAQVRALLPAGAGTVVVATSRSRLSGLALDGAHFLEVAPLPDTDALTVLEELVGRERVAGDVPAARRIVALCAGLPLAVSIVGARLAARPRRRLDDEARSLADDRHRLAVTVTGDRSVGAVFTSSYLELDDRARQVYRACAAHPGREFTAAPVAAALAWDATATGDVLAALMDVNLLVEVDDERYAYHDLVRAHARHCGETEEGVAETTARTRRMADWYLRHTVAADTVIHPLRPRVGPLYQGDHPRVFTGEQAAMSWLERERANLRSVVEQSWTHGWDDIAWQMCEALWGLFLHTRRYGDWIDIQRTGIASAQRCGDQRAEARLRSQLGFAYAKVERFADAVRENTTALEIADAVGDKQARATALSQLGRVARGTGDLTGALDYFRRARAAHEELGRPAGIALNQRRIGDVLTRMGELDAAVIELRTAADTMAALGNKTQHARSLQFLGVAHRLAGRLELAVAVLREAWAAIRDLDSPYYQAEVLAQLGEVAEQGGDRPAATDAYRQAGDLYAAVEDPRADLMRSRVTSLTTP
ncbi:tetratricopeptide repeat protein [Actinophytocola sp. KF-1]